MKRRQELENLGDKLDSLQEILLQRMDRVEQKMEDWRLKYQELQAALEVEQKQRAEEKQEREKDRTRELERMKLMQKQIEKLEEKVDELENRSKRVNLVFKRLKEESGETWRQAEEKVQELLEKKLGLKDIEIVRAHRVGWKQGERPRPIVAKFGKEKQRELVLQAKSKLRQTEILIDEDFSAKLRTERRRLFEIVKKEREQGRRARV